LENYAAVLSGLAQLVLSSLDENPSGYSFPINDTQRSLGKKLFKLLDDPNKDEKAIVAFHNFIFPFISARVIHGAYNKWDDVLECYLAVANLKPDGNFKEPKSQTQIYAIWKYHCRGGILYESISRVGDFGNDPHKQVQINYQVF